MLEILDCVIVYVVLRLSVCRLLFKILDFVIVYVDFCLDTYVYILSLFM